MLTAFLLPGFRRRPKPGDNEDLDLSDCTFPAEGLPDGSGDTHHLDDQASAVR